MINKTIQFLLLCLVLFFSSCTKQEQTITEEQKEQNAIAAIKNIVGNDVPITILSKKSNGNNLNSGNLKTNSTVDSIQLLTLDEFKALVIALKSTVKLSKVSSVDNASPFKPFDDFEPDVPGKPGRSGSHTQSFYTDIMMSGSNPRSILPTLNINYYTDVSGRVSGNPSLYFTGINIFPWTQQTTNPLINFNQNTLTSTFTINGTTLYGLSVFGLNIGVALGNSYKIVIHMDSSNGQDGWVEITSGIDGMK
jgi:hypothetical protein